MIKAEDDDTTPLSVTKNVTIKVNDINEAPTFDTFDDPTIDENSSSDTKASPRPTATDVDSGDTITFTATDGDTSVFAVASNGDISLKSGQSLNYESVREYW